VQHLALVMHLAVQETALYGAKVLLGNILSAARNLVR
jgi:hypothetical protein